MRFLSNPLSGWKHCQWIKESWDQITIECKKNGFRKTGICDTTVRVSEPDPYNESTDEQSSEESTEESLPYEELTDALFELLETFETDSDEEFEGFE